jgi:hypothetical protein
MTPGARQFVDLLAREIADELLRQPDDVAPAAHKVDTTNEKAAGPGRQSAARGLSHGDRTLRPEPC